MARRGTDSCEGCTIREACVEPCESIEAQLPKEWTGTNKHFHRAGRDNWLMNLMTRRRQVRVMLDYRPMLAGRLRQVVNLTFNDAMTQQEIARKLGVHERVVGKYLERAFALVGKLASGFKKGQIERRNGVKLRRRS
ncbi:MAG: hypothetical protein OEY28_12865 [Nitrospira sp.]|nr:hypothetical protein [Nitrospira sp.]